MDRFWSIDFAYLGRGALRLRVRHSECPLAAGTCRNEERQLGGRKVHASRCHPDSAGPIIISIAGSSANPPAPLRCARRYWEPGPSSSSRSTKISSERRANDEHSRRSAGIWSPRFPVRRVNRNRFGSWSPKAKQRHSISSAAVVRFPRMHKSQGSITVSAIPSARSAGNVTRPARRIYQCAAVVFPACPLASRRYGERGGAN
jgi:hypothetical protein